MLPVTHRLRRAEGQLRAVIRMLDEGRDCQAVLIQLAAVSKAIDRAGFAIIAQQLRSCLSAPDADSGSGADVEQLERLFLSLT